MGTLILTIEVLHLSPNVTLADLTSFFSYCGTVDKIQLLRYKDQSQSAFVTFRQPYAFHTALLLNGAILADQPIRVLPLQVSAIPPISDKSTNDTKENEIVRSIPVMQAMTSKSVGMLNKTKKELEENYKLSEKGRVRVQQTRSAICAAEQAAGRIGTVIMNNDYVSTGAIWLSHVLDKASKCALELGTRNRDNPNSGKLK